jgi:hypothetical protein
MTSSDPTASDEIRITMPAAARFARVARLALTGLASRNGFTYDEVEDVRIAVGELFSILADGAPPGARITLRCQMEDGFLEVAAEALPSRSLVPVGELSRQILSAVTAGATIDETRARITFTASADDRP